MSGSTSYRVSARLQLEGNADRTLQMVARALTSLDQGTVRTERNLRNLMRALNGLGGAGADVRRAAAAMDQLRAGSSSAGQAVRGATSSIQAQARALDRAAQAATNATTAMRSLGSAVPTGTINVRGGGHGGGTISRFGEAAVLGASGRSMGRGLGGTLVEAGAAQQAATVMRASGVTAEEQVRAEARAWEMTRDVRGTAMAENLQLIGQLRTTFETMEQAIEFAPAMARIAQTLAGVTGRDPGRQGQMAARFLDAIDAFVDPTSGTIDPARGMRLARMMEQSIVLQQGTVTPEEMLNFAKQGRLAMRRLDPSVMFGAMPSIIEQIGGHRTGTELSAMYRQIVSGVMTQRVADEMIRRNLLREQDIQVRRGGSVVVRPGSVAGAEQFARDPVTWVRDVLLPRLAATGAVTQDQQFQALSTLFGTETARGFVAQIIASMPQIQRNIRLYEAMPDDPGAIIAQGWNTTLRNFTAAFRNLMTAVGSAVMDDAIAVMNALAGAMNRLAALVREYPNATTYFVGLAAALAGLLTVGGLFAAGSVAWGGLTALAGGLGMAGLGGALLAIAPYVAVLGLIATGLTLLYEAIPGNTLAEKLNNIAAALGNLASSVQQALDQLAERVQAFLGRIAAAWNSTPEAWRQLDEQGPANQAPGGVQGRLRRNRDQMLRGLYPDDDPAAVPQNFNPAPPAGGGAATVPVILQLDGREVGRGILPHVGRAAGGPVQAAARFDGRRIYAT